MRRCEGEILYSMKTEGPATTTRNTVQTGAGAAVEPLARYIVVWPRRARVSFYELIISQFHRRKTNERSPHRKRLTRAGAKRALKRGTKTQEARKGTSDEEHCQSNAKRRRKSAIESGTTKATSTEGKTDPQ